MSNIKTKIKDLVQNLKQVFLRFPLACFFALILTILLSYLFVHVYVNAHELKHGELFFAITWGCGIAVLLAFAADLFCHLRKTYLPQRVWCNIAIVFASAICTWLMYSQCNNGFIEYYVFTTLFVTLLLMLVWPTWGQRSIEMTWNYNIRLIFAIAVTYILAHIIAFGIIAILLSIQYLFNIEMPHIIAVAIAVILAFFCPCCAMALMPINKDHYDKPLAYSKFLKVLVLYILLPLVCIEAIVLYIYALTILVSWQLPEGGVAYWVFSYAIAASIVWYLLMPIFRSEQPSKLKFLDQGFFISLIPLLVLLFVGLFRRIHDYGFTTNRYIVLVIACWFMAVAWIMIFRKSRNVTPLLGSLVIISLLALGGPWSMFSLPKTMQTKRFERITTEYNLLVHDFIMPSAEPLSREQNIALSESIDFFIDNKEYQQDFAEHYFGFSPEKTDSLIENGGYYNLKKQLMDQMNGDYISEWNRRQTDEEIAMEESNCSFSFYNKDEGKLYDITQYDYTFSYRTTNPNFNCFQTDHIKITVSDDALKKNILQLRINNNTVNINVIESLHLKSKLKENYNQFPLDGIFHEDAQMKLFLNVQYCEIEKDSTNTPSLSEISFDGYVKLKN